MRALRPLACLLAAVALALPASAAGAAVQARQADSFVDSIGVGVHLGFNDTPYVPQFATVKARLAELGVRHVRDDLLPGRNDQYQLLEALAAAGIGSTLILGSPHDGESGLEALLGVAAGLDGVEALEGPNEYSTLGADPEWIPHLREYQQWLYEKAKADPGLAGLPVVGPSIVHGDQDELGDVSAWLDFGNVHSYPQGDPPDKLGTFLNRAALNSGAKPVWATETGYHDALEWNGENRPVPEGVAATYLPRLFLEYWRWGIVRTFSYELLDEFPNPELDEAESHFGLLRNDLSRKPAFDALRNTIAVLADPGPAFAPGTLDYVLAEGGVPIPGPESSGLHKALLQKRDGSFYLALWRTTSVWDPLAKQVLPAPATPVEVSVSPGLLAASAYSPTVSATPIWSTAQPTQPLLVEVGPATTVLRLVPGVPPEPPPEERRGRPQPRPVRCVVPKLRGRSLAGARVRLRSSHCKLGTVAGTRGRGARIVRQQPRPGRVLDRGARISVKLRADG